MIARFALLLFTALTAVAAGDPARGKALFASCAGCHNVESDQRKMGPSLRSLFGRVTLRNGQRASDENVRQIVLDGYNGMPPFRYSFRPAEIDDLLAYLHTLTKPPAPAAQMSAGENVFRAFCLRCHNADAKNSAGPDLHGTPGSDQMQRVDEGHGGAPAMNAWLDAPSRENLLAYLRSR